MLLEQITKGFSGDINNALEILIDKITPMYQAHGLKNCPHRSKLY
jgi:hypothetical protein